MENRKQRKLHTGTARRKMHFFRGLSMLLSLLLLLSFLPVPASADEGFEDGVRDEENLYLPDEDSATEGDPQETGGEESNPDSVPEAGTEPEEDLDSAQLSPGAEDSGASAAPDTGGSSGLPGAESEAGGVNADGSETNDYGASGSDIAATGEPERDPEEVAADGADDSDDHNEDDNADLDNWDGEDLDEWPNDRDEDEEEEDYLFRRYGITGQRPGASGPLNMDDGSFFRSFASLAVAEEAEFSGYLRSHLGIPDENGIPDAAFQIAPLNEKYLDWYYDGAFSGSGAAEKRPPVEKLDSLFVLWCADRTGYLRHGFFPATDDRMTLFSELEAHGNPVFPLHGGGLTPQENDLIFEPGGDSGERFARVGIVVATDAETLTWVFCNRCGYPVLKTAPVAELPDETAFLRVAEVQDTLLLQAADFLEQELGISTAATAGILANIGYESDYFPRAVGDDDTAYGLCQWRLSRWDRLILFSESNGLNFRRTNAQLQYLVYELLHTEKRYPTLMKLRAAGNTARDACDAAYIFCLEFERPEYSELNGVRRGIYACRSLFPLLFPDARQPEILRELAELEDLLEALLEEAESTVKAKESASAENAEEAEDADVFTEAETDAAFEENDPGAVLPEDGSADPAAEALPEEETTGTETEAEAPAASTEVGGTAEAEEPAAPAGKADTESEPENSFE